MSRMFVCQPGRVMYSTSTSAKVSMLATTKRTNRNNVNMILERLQQKENSQYAHYLNSSCNYKKSPYLQKSAGAVTKKDMKRNPSCPYVFHSHVTGPYLQKSAGAVTKKDMKRNPSCPYAFHSHVTGPYLQKSAGAVTFPRYNFVAKS